MNKCDKNVEKYRYMMYNSREIIKRKVSYNIIKRYG